MRRLIYAPAVLVLALASLAFAADIKVEENPVPANSFAVVTMPTEKGDSVIWDVSPDPVKLKEVKGDTSAELHFSGPPGAVFTVNAFVVNFDSKKFDRKKQTVTISGAQPRPDPGPNPQPQPDPEPKPDPAPIGTVKRFVVVEDSSKAGAWRGSVLGSPKVAAMYKAAGLSHRLIDISADGDDTTATAYKQLATGKALPWLWLCDDSGKVLKDLACPTDPDKFCAAFDTHSGNRALGAILAKPKLKWSVFGESPNTPLIPRAQWKPVDLGTFLPPVHDQDGIGQCASSSACTVLEACRAQAGLPYVYMSAGDLYSRVNGGRDNGSMPEDNLAELLNNGVAPASAVPYIWNGRKYTDSATVTSRKPNRFAAAYICDSFDALASALQQGYICQIAVWWYDNFTPDSSGLLPRQGRGGKGGHALCAYGLTQLSDGTWALLVRNSWGTAWGNAGNCTMPESLFAGSNQFGNVWACRSVFQSKSDFPAPKLSLRAPFDRSDRFSLAP
ncbi:MAG TPA: C1 family peptidase [Gemmata sp.]